VSLSFCSMPTPGIRADGVAGVKHHHQTPKISSPNWVEIIRKTHLIFDFEKTAMPAQATTVESSSQNSHTPSPIVTSQPPILLLERDNPRQGQRVNPTSILATYVQQEERAERIVLGLSSCTAARPPLDASLLQILETL